MKVLVTGGARFIGSAVIRNIINNTTDNVINLNKLTHASNLESIAEVRNSDCYAFEKVDICDHAELGRIFNEYQPDAVMHLVAESHVDHAIDEPGHNMRYATDATKIATELNWTPQETFKTGIRKIVSWHLNNKSWWASLIDASYSDTRRGIAAIAVTS